MRRFLLQHIGGVGDGNEAKGEGNHRHRQQKTT